MSDAPSAAVAKIAVAVVAHGDALLIGQRQPGKELAGLWEFPGGKVEAKESPAAAAVRECQEETNIAIEVSHLLLRETASYAHGTVELFFYACQPVEAAPVPAPPFVWAPRASLRSYPFPAGNRRVIELLLREAD